MLSCFEHNGAGTRTYGPSGCENGIVVMSSLDRKSRAVGSFVGPGYEVCGPRSDPHPVGPDFGAPASGHDLLRLAQSLSRAACAALRREQDLERANQYKSRLLEATGRDLRQPLQAIRVCLDHLIARLTGGAPVGYVSGAREAIARLEHHLALLENAAAHDVGGLAEPAPPAPGSVQATIFVIDEDSAVRSSLCQIFRLRGWFVQTYASAEEFLGAERRADDWGCLVVEVRLPGMDALALLSVLQAAARTLPMVILTAPGDVRLAVAAMRAGAADCIEKPIRPEAILACVRRVLAQARERAQHALCDRLDARRIASLTPRERQIMDLVIAGHANKEIAARVAISQRTVEKHRAAVMKKAGAGSLAELIRIGLAAGAAPTSGRGSHRLAVPPEHPPGRRPEGQAIGTRASGVQT